ncbi:MAG: M48 family metalloprotease [Fimbriimonadaceae bacterium]|nr:M48 family metalloprotease [Alphaproteobacteria bacterium]
MTQVMQTRGLPIWHYALFGLVLLLLTGCSTDKETAGFGFENDSLLISEERERELGAQEHPKILAAFGGAYVNPRLQAGLDDIVHRLTRVSPRPDISYRLTILNTPSVNAFALPGGFLYVTRGLLALANDEDEVAAVLSHEMGHVSSRHAVKRENQASATSVIGQVMKDIMRNPGQAANAMTDSRANFASFSRSQEYEADQIGLETAVQAGFDPFAASTFLTSMQRNNKFRNRLVANGESSNPSADFMATHPSTPDRISRVTQLSRSFGFDEGDRRRSRDSFLNLLDGMTYGNDPSEGFVRDRRFIHPELGFEFEVAEGFTIQNTSDAVFALGPNGSALRFDGVDVPVSQSLKIYVTRIWAKGISVENLQVTSINGMDAVVGEANHGGWDYRLGAIRFDGKRTFRFLMAARKFTSQMTADFDASIRSLRALSREDARNIRPFRIRVATVKSSETVQTYADRMGIREGALEQFRIINGMTPGQRLQPGQMVKIIAD